MELSKKAKIGIGIGLALLVGAGLYFYFTSKAEDVAEGAGEDGKVAGEESTAPEEQKAKILSGMEQIKKTEASNKGKTLEQTGGRPGAIRSADGSASWGA